MENDLLVLHKRCTKLKPNMGPQSRFCSWPISGAPQVVDLVLRWSAVRDKAWADAGGSPGHFYTLPGEHDPSAWTISGWFGPLLQTLPLPPVDHFDLHGLCAGGATACYALEVPKRRITLWGDWRSGARWSYIDVYKVPTEWDYRLFGWMTITAGELHAWYRHIFCPGGASSSQG